MDTPQTDGAVSRQATRSDALVQAGHIAWTADAAGQAGDMSSWSLYTGQDEAKVVGLGWLDAIHPEERRRAIRTWLEAVDSQTIWECECRIRQRDGTYRVFLMRGAPVLESNGAVREWAGFCTDVTERVESRAEVDEHRATHDALTDLPNRNLFVDRLHHATLVARRNSHPLAVVAIDFDYFRGVNDAFGHDEGDLLLQLAAARLQEALRESDTIARVGGDEFAMVLPAADELGAVLALRRIFVAIDQSFEVSGQKVDLTASAGVALYPEHSIDATTLLHHAEAAMYTASQLKSGYVIYGRGQNESASLRLTLSTELRQAIEQNEFQLRYEPKVDIQTRRATSVEVRVYWDHPEHGFMPSETFIPVAELSGLINALTMSVLDGALRQCRAWNEAGLRVGVAVNLSARNLRDPRLVDEIARLLETHKVDPSSLEIELQESPIMAEPERVHRVLDRLHQVGVRLCIDDFGTGYSSLVQLRALPVQEVKIHRSRVADIAGDEDSALVVQALIQAGHTLGLTVAAEGVDTQQTWEVLASLGCDRAQGFRLSEPLDADDVPHWVLTDHEF